MTKAILASLALSAMMIAPTIAKKPDFGAFFGGEEKKEVTSKDDGNTCKNEKRQLLEKIEDKLDDLQKEIKANRKKI